MLTNKYSRQKSGFLRKIIFFFLNECNARKRNAMGRSSYQIAGGNARISEDFSLVIRKPHLEVKEERQVV